MNWYLPILGRCFTYRPQPNRPCNPPKPVVCPAPSPPEASDKTEQGDQCPHSTCKNEPSVPYAQNFCTNVPAAAPPPPPPKRYPNIRTYFLKCDSLSSIIIPDGTLAHTRYPLATLSLDNTKNNIRQIYFTFSCNIRTEQAILFLNLHITQQGKNHFVPLPMQSNWNYSQQTNSSMTDAVTFSTCCFDLIADSCCTICFWADLLGTSQGTTYITNSILTALVQETI